MICPGSCNHRWREARDAHADALDAWYDADLATRGDPPPPPERVPEYGQPIWCARCSSRIRHALGEIDDLAVQVERYLDGHRAGPSSDRVSGSADPRSPSPMADQLDGLYAHLSDAERWYRDEVGLVHPDRSGRGPLARSLTIAWLTTHLDGVLARYWAEEWGTETLQWHKRLRAMARIDPERLTLPCPSCDCRALTRDLDDVVCGYCGRTMTYDDYELMLIKEVTRS